VGDPSVTVHDPEATLRRWSFLALKLTEC